MGGNSMKMNVTLNMSVTSVFALLVSVMHSVGQNQTQMYTLVDLGTLGGSTSSAYAINSNGQVVGSSATTDYLTFHAFLYENGSMKDLGTLGGKYSAAYGINNIGQIVGGSYIVGDAEEHAFLHSNIMMRDLGTLNVNNSRALAINDSGTIVGCLFSGFNYSAFVYSDGLMQDITSSLSSNGSANAINAKGEIVGTVDIGYPRSFIYYKGSMSYIDLSSASYANGINDSSVVIGNFRKDHVFEYLNGSVHDLGTPGFNCSPNGINASGIVVGEYYSVSSNDYHAFVYSGETMKDLNTMLASNSGIVVENATAINDRGQIVGYGRLSREIYHAVLLNPIPTGAIEAISSAVPVKPVYGNLPVKESMKDSLVVVTHGWQPYPATPNVGWIDDMTNALSGFLKVHNDDTWQVVAYKWVNKSWTVSPQTALDNAKQEGVNLGVWIVTMGYTHVHLVGHSAGAGLAQAASEWIKAIAPNTVVQCTFLDPFVGLHLEETDNFGNGSDWSDSYLSDDIETGGKIYPLTDSLLSHAYNVNVTYLNKVQDVSAFISTDSGVNEPCMRTVASHGWPIAFYSNTIAGSVSPEYKGFGFPLSQEVGKLDDIKQAYPAGNKPWKVLGTPDEECISYTSNGGGGYQRMLIDIGGTPSTDFGSVQKSATDLNIQTHSPSWTAMFITVTDRVNSVSFDARFTSAAGSRGLLSLYWDTNSIGVLDEEAVQSGSRKYTFAFQSAEANSLHVLGFRLDPLADVQSSIVVTNLVLDNTGVNQPFSLSFTTNVIGRLPVFRLTGQSGFNYAVQTSTDLVSWNTIAILVNTNGSVDFVDYGSTNYSRRLYRALAPN